MFKSFFIPLVLFATPVIACTVQDDDGTVINLTVPATRIITLAPDIAEIVFAIGGGEKVQGVIAGSDYPAAASRVPVVGSYLGLDQEKMMSLHPDLIITWGGNFSRQLQVFQRLKVPVYVVRTKKIADVTRTMKNLGCLLGLESQAKKSIEIFNSQLPTKRPPRPLAGEGRGEGKGAQQPSPQPSPASGRGGRFVPRVFFQIGRYALYTINHESWISEAITLCGGENIFASAKIPAPIVDMESILKANPDVIITDDPAPSWQARWQAWPQLSAVKSKHLASVPADLLERAGPRLPQGVQALCQAIHTPSDPGNRVQ